jgi:hypothetical protein
VVAKVSSLMTALDLGVWDDHRRAFSAAVRAVSKDG